MSEAKLFAHFLLNSPNIKDKLTRFDSFKNIDYQCDYLDRHIFEKPARTKDLSFSDEQIKFPKKGALKADPVQKGRALHFFANHELLAIEMMAQAILKFDITEADINTLIKTIGDEQKHLELYINRMNDYEVVFGQFPLNAFFWSYMDRIESAEQFYCVMALTFEQANLDFSNYYCQVFEEIGDLKTAKIMKVIYEDEIAHVARGYSYIKKKITDPNQLWQFFVSQLPEPLGPERAKGMIFDEKARSRSGLNSTYIESLKDFKTDFRVTKRKQWS